MLCQKIKNKIESYDKRLSTHFNYHRFIRRCREFHRANGKDPVAAILVHARRMAKARLEA